ncbi:hypothetical protein WOLCODRAFT_159186 [Wolfiporia cocos MD-104 SS10]|uniref:Uncharacterized protein n=1 Tax=Wolfiporia cocos (strain MD-104) TaxID=742152 RepID=A0A2H3JIA6_WOLCO|nr:hypothetical protein WOLCODRAFT_159186 [Wolfiporia cocos MD-104 SS10]
MEEWKTKDTSSMDNTTLRVLQESQRLGTIPNDGQGKGQAPHSRTEGHRNLEAQQKPPEGNERTPADGSTDARES